MSEWIQKDRVRERKHHPQILIYQPSGKKKNEGEIFNIAKVEFWEINYNSQEDYKN